MSGKKKRVDIKKIIYYWQESSQKDFQITETLFRLKHYAPSLFFCHLCLEKLLKSLVVNKTKTHAPPIHDLGALAEKAGLSLSKKQLEELEIISTFNIRARYDDLKFSFYKKCNRAYAEKYLEISKRLYLWLKKQYLKK